jgi:hypothetical protein
MWSTVRPPTASGRTTGSPSSCGGVYETAFEKSRCFAAFAHLPDAEHYAAAMRKLNPRRKFDVVAE